MLFLTEWYIAYRQYSNYLTWLRETNSASIPTTSPLLGSSGKERGVNVAGDWTGLGWWVSANNTDGSRLHVTVDKSISNRLYAIRQCGVCQCHYQHQMVSE